VATNYRLSSEFVFGIIHGFNPSQLALSGYFRMGANNFVTFFYIGLLFAT
jgi:hypothetical protein